MMKNSRVEISISAARSMCCNNGMKPLSVISTTTPSTMNSTIFSCALIGPRPADRRLTVSLQAGNGLLFRFQENDQVEPDQQHHEPADHEHVGRELEKADLVAGEFLEHAGRGRAARSTEEGDDAAGACGVGHADEQALAEVGAACRPRRTGSRWPAGWGTWWRPRRYAPSGGPGRPSPPGSRAGSCRCSRRRPPASCRPCAGSGRTW